MRQRISGPWFWRAVRENLGTKLISVAIAAALWFIVLGSRNVEATKEVPLEVITSPDLTPSNEIPEKIAFRLSGPKAFLRAILDRRDEPIRVNMGGAKPGLVTYRFFSDNIRLPIGVKVLSVNPTAILIKLEPVKRKDVPVKVEVHGVPADGFRVAGARVTPEVVRISGAETKVDAISELVTSSVDATGLKQSINKEAVFDLARYGVQLDGPLPKIQLDIEPASANFRIKNVEIKVLSELTAKVEEKGVQLLVRVNPKDLRLLDRSRVTVVVDLSGKKKGKYLEPVKVTLPPSVGLVKVIPEYVHVNLY